MADEKGPTTPQEFDDENLDPSSETPLDPDNEIAGFSVDELAEVADDEWLQGLFADPNDDNSKVQVYRFEPRYYRGEPTHGYVTDLYPGDSIKTLKDEHGGGYYMFRQQINGRFSQQQRRLHIVGPPRVSSLSPGATAVAVDKKLQAITKGTLDLGGIEVPIGDLEALKEVALFKKAMDIILPPKEDINDVLLKMLLERTDPPPPPDPLGQIDQLTSIADKLKQITGGGGGEWWQDLGAEALKAVTAFAEAANRGGQPVAPRPAIPQKPPEIAPGTAPAEIVENTAQDSEPAEQQAQETAKMNVMQTAEKAASYIVAGYLLEPQQTPGEVKEVLDQVLPFMDDAARQNLKNYQRILRNIANSLISTQAVIEDDTMREFGEYFTLVFDRFIDDIDEDPQPPKESTGENGQNHDHGSTETKD